MEASWVVHHLRRLPVPLEAHPFVECLERQAMADERRHANPVAGK
jgi:hypothetical protein